MGQNASNISVGVSGAKNVFVLPHTLGFFQSTQTGTDQPSAKNTALNLK